MMTWAEFIGPDRSPSRAECLLVTVLGEVVAVGVTFAFWLAVWRVVFAVSG